MSQSRKRELVQSIVRGIRRDIEGYKQLKSMLQNQRELMQRRDSQGLERHNAQQSQLCEQLMGQATQRRAELEALGLTGDPAGMAILISKLPANASAQVEKQWSALLELVTQSQKANEANGELLVAQQEVINNLIHHNNEPSNDYGNSLR